MNGVFRAGLWSSPESLEESAKREIFEETGLTVEIEPLIGVYSKYLTEFPNGDQAQTITQFFQCKPILGELKADGTPTQALPTSCRHGL